MELEHIGHRTDRPWGYYVILDHGDGFQVKRIVVHPGQRLSYQRHRHRSEYWTIIAGECLLTLDDHDEKKQVGDVILIPSGTKHRVQNIGQEDFAFIEVQHGSYLGEDDIERFSDDYGRA